MPQSNIKPAKKRKNSKKKGSRVEREWVNFLKERGVFSARRTQQYCGANSDSDVETAVELPFIHHEVKGVEALNIYDAIEQAVADAAKSGRTPIVAHKKNFKPFLVTMRAEDWLDFAIARARENSTQGGNGGGSRRVPDRVDDESGGLPIRFEGMFDLNGQGALGSQHVAGMANPARPERELPEDSV